MGRQGCLIAIEGIDGGGKATQTEILKDHLAAEGIEVDSYSFPRYGESFFGRLVERYLRGEFGADPQAVSPWLASLPYACDRWQVAGEMREALEAGTAVICNRYVSANMGHQGAKLDDPGRRAEFFRWVDEMEYDILGVPRPDIQVWLHVPVEVSLQLILERSQRAGNTHQDIHETWTHLSRANASFQQMIQLMPGWFRVDCVDGKQLKSREEIADMVWSHVHPILMSRQTGSANDGP